LPINYQRGLDRATSVFIACRAPAAPLPDNADVDFAPRQTHDPPASLSPPSNSILLI